MSYSIDKPHANLLWKGDYLPPALTGNLAKSVDVFLYYYSRFIKGIVSGESVQTCKSVE